MARNSDRWVTPGVVMVFLVVAGLVITAVFGAVTYLTVRGYDPAPVVDLVATLVAAVGSIGTLVATLLQRKTTAKVERNTGLQARELMNLTDRLDDPGRHAYPDTTYQTARSLPPVPPERGTAPAATGR
jgi:hypothetical protein